MDSDPQHLIFQIHPSTFEKIEQSGGAGLLFGEDGLFQRMDSNGQAEFLWFEMPEGKRGEVLRLIRSLPVSTRGEIVVAGRQILRNGVQSHGGYYTLIQGLRGFEGMELPSCLGLVYQYLKKGNEETPNFWGSGVEGEMLRRDFSLVQEDLEHDSRDAGWVAENSNLLASQLTGRADLVRQGAGPADEVFAGGWVFEIDTSAIAVTVRPCREEGKTGEGVGLPPAKRSHTRDPLGRSAFLVVAPVGCGNCEEEDNRRKMRTLIGSTLLQVLRKIGDSNNPKDQDYLLITRESLEAYSEEQGETAFSRAIRACLGGVGTKDVSEEEEIVEQFFQFLSWAETRSASPIFIGGGGGIPGTFHGLPEGFVSCLVKAVEARGSGFSSHVFDTSYDPDLKTTGTEPSSSERVAGVERVIASRSSQDWTDLGRIRQKLFEELDNGSPDFLSLVTGSVWAGAGDLAGDGEKWKALKRGLGPEFAETDGQLTWELIDSLRKFQETWGGRTARAGSLVDFANFLLIRAGNSFPEDLRTGLRDAVDRVKGDGKKTSGTQTSLYDKMENRERLGEAVTAVVASLLGRGEDGKLSEEEKESERKILGRLVSNADKAENVYAMWRFGTADIKFGKAKDVLNEGVALSQEGTPILPLCSWTEDNIPIGDWNTSLLINIFNLEEGEAYPSFKGVTGILPSDDDGKSEVERRERRRRRLEALLAIFGVDKSNLIDKESFTDMLMDGLEARLGRAREAEVDEFENNKTLAALVKGAIDDTELEKKLVRLMKDDCDTVKLWFGEVRPDTNPMIPMLAGLLRIRDRMGRAGESEEKDVVAGEALDLTSSLLVSATLICGGITDEDLAGSCTVSEWARRVATQAKNFGGVLGQTKEARIATYKYRRQYGTLNMEKLVLSKADAFRISGEDNQKTEVCGAVGYYLNPMLAKIEEGLPEQVRNSRRDYLKEVWTGEMQETIRRYSKGNIYLSRPQTLIQEEVAQYRKRKTAEAQILCDRVIINPKPENPSEV